MRKAPEYDHDKFERFVLADKFLLYAYGRRRDHDPNTSNATVFRILFNTYVDGNSEMEHAYAKFK